MATWTDISNAEVAAGAALTTALMTALRDNIIAIPNGDTGAPVIQYKAIGGPLVAGAVEKLALDGSSQTNSGVDTICKVLILQSGSVRLTLDQRITVTGTSTVVVIVGGVTVQTWNTSSTTDVSRTLDITVNVGDVIAITNTSNNTQSSVVSNAKLSTTGASITPWGLFGISGFTL